MRALVSFRSIAPALIALLVGSANAVAQTPATHPVTPTVGSPTGATARERGLVVQGEPFSVRQVRDPQNGGQVVIVFRAPQTWRDTSQVAWDLSAMESPAALAIQVANPANEEAFNRYHDVRFFSLRPDDGSVRVGQTLMGAVRLNPMPPCQALLGMVRRARGNLPKFQVVGCKDLPRLPGVAGMPANTHARGVGLKVSYDLSGKPVDEEFYAIHNWVDLPYDGPQGRTWQTNWGLATPYSFRAPAGTLDRRRPVFAVIANSGRLNPAWNRRVEAVSHALEAEFQRNLQVTYDRIAAARRYSEQITANSNAFLANVDRQRQATYGAQGDSGGSPDERGANGRFQDYQRGVTTLDDPYYGTTEQSNVYEYHWTDGYGAIRNSNDSNYDPNRTENGGSWEQMTPTR